MHKCAVSRILSPSGTYTFSAMLTHINAINVPLSYRGTLLERLEPFFVPMEAPNAAPLLLKPYAAGFKTVVSDAIPGTGGALISMDTLSKALWRAIVRSRGVYDA